MLTAHQNLPNLQLDPQKINATLDELSNKTLLTDEERQNVEAEMQIGSPFYAALSIHTRETLIWEYFAASRDMKFYPKHSDLRIYATDMLSGPECLALGILPHRPKIPFSEAVTYQIDILEHPPRQIAESRARYALITPTIYKHLYHLGYPEPLTGPLSPSQARALITATPEHSITLGSPHQEAEINALAHGHRYIDVRRDPPDADVQGLISLSVKARTRTYPHHIEGIYLAVLMSSANDQTVQTLRTHTQMKILPVITTPDAIVKLIQEENDTKARNEIEELTLHAVPT